MMTIQRTQHPIEAEEWLTVQDACTLLGVSPATLRRWSAAGDVPAFTTPGGHRRYARSTILSLLPDTGSGRPTLAELGLTPDRMVRAFRRSMVQATRGLGWLPRVSEEEIATIRALGRTICSRLLIALDAHTVGERDAAVEEARVAAARYGQLAARAGSRAGETAEAFVRFRSLFVEELAQVARRQGLDAADATRLVTDAVGLSDRLLPPLLAGTNLC